MKTAYHLLLLTEGRPTMTYEEFAALTHKSPRTILNEIHGKRVPVPFWKYGDLWMCNISDVAQWMDTCRDDAIKAQRSFERYELSLT